MANHTASLEPRINWSRWPKPRWPTSSCGGHRRRALHQRSQDAYRLFARSGRGGAPERNSAAPRAAGERPGPPLDRRLDVSAHDRPRQRAHGVAYTRMTAVAPPGSKWGWSLRLRPERAARRSCCTREGVYPPRTLGVRRLFSTGYRIRGYANQLIGKGLGSRDAQTKELAAAPSTFLSAGRPDGGARAVRTGPHSATRAKRVSRRGGTGSIFIVRVLANLPAKCGWDRGRMRRMRRSLWTELSCYTTQCGCEVGGWNPRSHPPRRTRPRAPGHLTTVHRSLFPVTPQTAANDDPSACTSKWPIAAE